MSTIPAMGNAMSVVDPALDDGIYLGPALVGRVAGRSIELAFPDERVWARMAIAQSYQAVPGDTVLAVGQGGNWYVIGVLKGQGVTSITVPCDLSICAPHGKIDLQAAHGIHVKSPSVRVTADRIDFVARRLFERLTDATRWVKNTCRIRAGRMRQDVENDYRLGAKNILGRARNDVKLDGNRINLG